MLGSRGRWLDRWNLWVPVREVRNGLDITQERSLLQDLQVMLFCDGFLEV